MIPSQDTDHAVKSWAVKIRDKLYYTSEKLGEPKYLYVAWIDLMGAGHMMGTSVHKTANFLSRLHMAVEIAVRESGHEIELLPINDGIFILSDSKKNIIRIVQHTVVLRAGHFVSTPRMQDRCLIRGAIAFGPVYDGKQMRQGMDLKYFEKCPDFLDRVLFGPPIYQAYSAERLAPPYGIALHESARAFAPAKESPFRLTHWLWWINNTSDEPIPNIPPLRSLKDVLSKELDKQYSWLLKTLLFHELNAEKVKSWKEISTQYFSDGS